MSTASAWVVGEITHLTTGQTIAPDEQTGDEWTVEWVNEHFPAARVIETFAVVRYPVDEEGKRIDTVEIPDEEAHEHWRYAVQEQTEFLTTTTPEDFWSGEVETVHTQYGDGSYFEYDTEERADRECERMARHAAAVEEAITWDGSPIAV